MERNLSDNKATLVDRLRQQRDVMESVYPKWAKETARDLADWVKCGYEVVGLVTRSESVRGMEEYCAEKKRRASEPQQAVLPQDGLFA